MAMDPQRLMRLATVASTSVALTLLGAKAVAWVVTDSVTATAVPTPAEEAPAVAIVPTASKLRCWPPLARSQTVTCPSAAKLAR